MNFPTDGKVIQLDKATAEGPYEWLVVLESPLRGVLTTKRLFYTHSSPFWGHMGKNAWHSKGVQMHLTRSNFLN